MQTTFDQNRDTFNALRQLRQSRSQVVEYCDLCGQALPAEHEHLIEPNERKLHCACRACALLFSGEQSTRYRLVPKRVQYLADFSPSDAQWDRLLIPINLAFFFQSSVTGRIMAAYPSPAGATESHLELEAWEEFSADCPRLAHLQPDVEALLVSRGPRGNQYFLVSIERCYELVGLIRLHWRGLSGGTEVWKRVTHFFHELDRRAKEGARHACQNA